MGVIEIIEKIKGNPFEKLKRDDLSAERIRLEREEKLKTAENERISSQVKDLFNKGFKASSRERISLDTKIETLERKIKQNDNILKSINKEIRVTDNLIYSIENKQLLERNGLIPKLLKLPKTQLNKFLSEENVADLVYKDKVSDFLETLESDYGIHDDETDAKTKRIRIWETHDIADADEAYEEYNKEQNKEQDTDFDQL
jgi:hypothetical protein